MRRELWLSRKKMLAAEVYGYSYANYEDHLGIGNIRYEKLMPADMDILERAEQEGWEASQVAVALDMPEDLVAPLQGAFREAKEIVDAPTLAESFRRGVRVSVERAVEEGLSDTGSVERLVTQICYRAADLAFRLDMEGLLLSDFSEELRQETEYDRVYLQKMIQQEVQEKLDREQGKGKG